MYIENGHRKLNSTFNQRKHLPPVRFVIENCSLRIKISVSYIKTKYMLIYFDKIKTVYIHNMNTGK